MKELTGIVVTTLTGGRVLITPHPRLVDRIRQKLDNGQLPTAAPEKVSASYGALQPCDACGAKIPHTLVEYSFESDERTFHFHVGCYGFWEAECRRRGLRERGSSWAWVPGI